MWLHLVWSTKNRKPLLAKEIRLEVFDHIRANAFVKGMHIDQINGFTDHVHCLVSLKPEQSVSKMVPLIKGESAYWINKNGLVKDHFGWQRQYFAASVSLTDLGRIRHYIRNQEHDHKTIPFANEVRDLISGQKFNGC